jgi:hypothetical protein
MMLDKNGGRSGALVFCDTNIRYLSPRSNYSGHYGLIHTSKYADSVQLLTADVKPPPHPELD